MVSSNKVYTDVNELVNEWVDSYNAKDFDRFGAVLADDVDYVCGAFGLTFTGRDAFVGHVQEYAGAVPDRKLTLKRVIAEGDAVALEYDFAGTSSGAHPGLPPAGAPVNVSFCTVMQLRGGRIASQTDYLGGQ
ncbi:ester cyclase [Streptomyces roseifaciens]|uniref:ester cyclase n=1 Tax=Streptomyces roseifaciens TaxID=1488406 RepID=UPI0007180CC8|nr:nuclear transport factor 2 family protein [Streptomyces roseifaciens]